MGYRSEHRANLIFKVNCLPETRDSDPNGTLRDLDRIDRTLLRAWQDDGRAPIQMGILSLTTEGPFHGQPVSDERGSG